MAVATVALPAPGLDARRSLQPERRSVPLALHAPEPHGLLGRPRQKHTLRQQAARGGSEIPLLHVYAKLLYQQKLARSSITKRRNSA